MRNQVGLLSILDAPLLIHSLSYQLMLLRSGSSVVEDGPAAIARLENQISALRAGLPPCIRLFPSTSWSSIASALERPGATWRVHSEEDFTKKGMFRVILTVGEQMWNTEVAFEPEVADVNGRNLSAFLDSHCDGGVGDLPRRDIVHARELSDG